VTTLVVPPPDEEFWPTLGPQVCRFIEEFGVYGPGPLQGQPYRIEPEFRAQLYRAYEVFPENHPRAGRRRFKRVVLSMRKGTAKTEKAMQVCLAEVHPDGPVRCDGFDAYGNPVGRGVPSNPYIPLLAYAREQAEDLAYFVLKDIIEHSDLVDDFDIGEERILLLDDRGREAGKIAAMAGSPNARDGGRTTWQHFDETHRLYLPKLVEAHNTMQENIYKLVPADAWSMATTTAPEPGQGSVAEQDMHYAELVAAGKVSDPQLFFFHRQARDGAPLETPEQVREALVEASGPAVEWSADIDALVSHYFEPSCDQEYYKRVWLNWLQSSGMRAFDVIRWDELAHPEVYIPAGERVVVGFDGSRFNDATAVVVTAIKSGHQLLLGLWERDENDPEWEVDRDEVTARLETAFETWKVWRLYGDPPGWDTEFKTWQGRWGKRRVIEWWTNRHKPMAYALKGYREAMQAGDVGHDGDPAFRAHIANAVRANLNIVDEDEQPLWLIQKERRDSPKKIDAAMAGCLSWEARKDAVAEGKARERKGSKGAGGLW
jgi:hypothetical protein